MRIVTFNVQNMRLRRDGRGHATLDGARDADVPEDAAEGAVALDPADRRLTAAVLARADADIVALQEVFDQDTLDHFHDRYLVPAGAAPYPVRHCLPGNDGRGLDVAVMSRRPLDTVISHADATPRGLGVEPPDGIDPDQRVFRRDCLVVQVGALWLFIVHLKAPYPDPCAVWPVRRAEAQALRALVARHVGAPARVPWLILGDLNEPARENHRNRAIAPILPPFSVDLMARLPAQDRWSWYEPHERLYGRPDAMLASPVLADRFADAVPRIIRAGMGAEVARASGPRLPGVGRHRPHASDHAAVAIDLSDLPRGGVAGQ